jgi:hypothetical protein
MGEEIPLLSLRVAASRRGGGAPASGDVRWKIRADGGTSYLLMRARKEGNRTVQSANPDFGCAGVEIEGAFFVDFGNGIGGGEDLDADLGSALEKGDLADILEALRRDPGNVNGFDAGGGGDGALRHGMAVWEKTAQQSSDMYLAFAVERSWRRAHEDVAMLVGLDAIGQLRQVRIGQDLGPLNQVEPGLRNEIRKLNGDRHRGKIHQKRKKRMNSGSKRRGRISRATAIACVGTLALLGLMLGGGVRINGSKSFPVGLYVATGKAPEKGDLVFVDPPA